ncbi:MAG: hypothetical protein U1E81_10005 [Xanthobacteraceae bacterium]
MFEVEKFERKRIEEIVLRAEADGDLAEEDRSEIRKFLRVTWYQKIGCCFFKDKAEDEPISFTSPCLDPKAFPDWESLEEDYWIMWLPKKGGNLIDPKGDFIRAIRCIYIEILGKSLAETYLDIGSEYWQYVNSIVNRALDEYRNPV